MPSLYVALHSGIHSASVRPRYSKKCRIVLNVASPTPIVPTPADSMSVMDRRSPNAARRYVAVIQPAVPPPTITTLFTVRSSSLLSMTLSARDSQPRSRRRPRQRHIREQVTVQRDDCDIPSDPRQDHRRLALSIIHVWREAI